MGLRHYHVIVVFGHSVRGAQGGLKRGGSRVGREKDFIGSDGSRGQAFDRQKSGSKVRGRSAVVSFRLMPMAECNAISTHARCILPACTISS